MRKLVTIQKINNIRDIEGRDRVQLGTILGYDVIIGKGEFQEGSYVGFAEVDSVFPKDGNWPELERFKYRIRTFKVNTTNGPVFGQGYCFPLSKLIDIVGVCPDTWTEGIEITEVLDVVKFEPPVDYAEGDTKGTFPTKWIPKTDESRVSSNLGVLDELRGLPYVIRLKYDGQSNTSFIAPDTNETLVCSRSLIKKDPVDSGKPSIFWEIFNKYNLKRVYETYPDYAMQYEGVGGKIQSNRMGVQGFEAGVFNIWKLSERRYLNHDEFEDMMKKFQIISPSIKACEVIEIGDNFQHTLESLKGLSMRKYSSGKWAEGLVIRPQKEMFSRTLGSRLSFKMINPYFQAEGGN